SSGIMYQGRITLLTYIAAAALVLVGGDYAAEQDATTAVETIQRKREALDERAEELLEELETVVTRRSELEQQVQAIQQQAQRPQQGE
ncbi:MAG: hypothetical protein RI531_06640, partial [Haloferacaceae archaeon]|nr:hypothetical protein [Haloferacaceae archaeon]